MHEAHTPGAVPSIVKLSDRQLVDRINRIRECDGLDVTEDLLWLFYATIGPGRPILDQLMLRAYPAGNRILLCSAPVIELLDRLELSVLEELGDGHFTYDDAGELHGRIAVAAAKHLSDVLADITHDVVLVESQLFATVSQRVELVDALRRGLISPTSVLVHLHEVFDRKLQREYGVLPNPIDATAARVVDVLVALRDDAFAEFVSETRRTLWALGQLTEVERFRVMIVGYRKSEIRRAQRPGTGYLSVTELCAVFPGTRSLKVQISEAMGRLADLRLDALAGASETTITSGVLRSRTWRTGAAFIERSLGLDSQ